MIKGFIFDLDGVITDTAELHYEAWKKLAEEMDWTFDRELNEKLRGISRMDSIKVIMDHNNATLEEEKILELATNKNNIYVDSLDSMTQEDYLPGVKELLTHLRTEGFNVALGSASKNAIKVLEQLNANMYFDVIGDGNSVAKSKPAPDIFIYGAEKMGLQPDECIVFEDAEKGIDAAKAGGFHSIGIGPEERVGHADLRFDSMADATLFEVKAHFKELFS
ncbi:beta-phosphoglucomutase [Flagellimonas nanhaiensis]|uniref:Beta-phosphoglucomutase n=1 Tax=Flagellimonas nanhaiensis TaxID=2292706 RepID=A0A371JMB6_9FLAO|nr:beta-phosphoglucomutase [Allomuricauda nanhaiensis]RDY58289.1 beta-phosphoglucomutase [Allomuricauda nanhaiensis]